MTFFPVQEILLQFHNLWDWIFHQLSVVQSEPLFQLLNQLFLAWYLLAFALEFFLFCTAFIGLRTMSGHFTSYRHVVGPWLFAGWILDRWSGSTGGVKFEQWSEGSGELCKVWEKNNPRAREQTLHKQQEGQGESELSEEKWDGGDVLALNDVGFHESCQEFGGLSSRWLASMRFQCIW